jgi:hypothetical protein
VSLSADADAAPAIMSVTHADTGGQPEGAAGSQKVCGKMAA